MYGYRMMDGYGYEAGWGWVMMLICAVLFAFLVVVVLRAIRGRQGMMMGMHDMQKQGPDALDIVRERYAKGEINKEQFEQLKKDLSK